MKVVGKIIEERNYDLFKRLPENRDVGNARVSKLIASISERYIINPVIVNEKMEIIDGQGRYEALKALRMPIHYIVAYGATSKDCVRMNKYNTKWTVYDFANSYAKAGKKAYICLLSVCKEVSQPISRVLRLANRYTVPHGGTSGLSPYERGDLIFAEKEKTAVINVVTKGNELIEALQFTGRTNDSFYTAVKIMIETDGYIHDSMIKRCEKSRGSYVQMSSLKNQLLEFDRIYNLNRRGSSKIYFSDYLRNKGSNVRSYECNKRKWDDIKDISTLK